LSLLILKKTKLLVKPVSIEYTIIVEQIKIFDRN